MGHRYCVELAKAEMPLRSKYTTIKHHCSTFHVVSSQQESAKVNNINLHIFP